MIAAEPPASENTAKGINPLYSVEHKMPLRKGICRETGKLTAGEKFTHFLKCIIYGMGLCVSIKLDGCPSGLLLPGHSIAGFCPTVLHCD